MSTCMRFMHEELGLGEAVKAPARADKGLQEPWLRLGRDALDHRPDVLCRLEDGRVKGLNGGLDAMPGAPAETVESFHCDDLWREGVDKR